MTAPWDVQTACHAHRLANLASYQPAEAHVASSVDPRLYAVSIDAPCENHLEQLRLFSSADGPRQTFALFPPVVEVTLREFTSDGSLASESTTPWSQVTNTASTDCE